MPATPASAGFGSGVVEGCPIDLFDDDSCSEDSESSSQPGRDGADEPKTGYMSLASLDDYDQYEGDPKKFIDHLWDMASSDTEDEAFEFDDPASKRHASDAATMSPPPSSSGLEIMSYASEDSSTLSLTPFESSPKVQHLGMAGLNLQTLASTSVPPPPPPNPPMMVTQAPEVLTVGSILHATGRCTPCKFFRGNRGCKAGANCNLCHYGHEELTYSGIRRLMRRKGFQVKGLRQRLVRETTQTGDAQANCATPLGPKIDTLGMEHYRYTGLPPPGLNSCGAAGLAGGASPMPARAASAAAAAAPDGLAPPRADEAHPFAPTQHRVLPFTPAFNIMGPSLMSL